MEGALSPKCFVSKDTTFRKTPTILKRFISGPRLAVWSRCMTNELETKHEAIPNLVDEDSLLTPHELAALLRVPVSWVYAQTRGRSKAGLPFVKMGRYVRFDRAAVRKFIATNAKVGR